MAPRIGERDLIDNRESAGGQPIRNLGAIDNVLREFQPETSVINQVG